MRYTQEGSEPTVSNDQSLQLANGTRNVPVVSAKDVHFHVFGDLRTLFFVRPKLSFGISSKGNKHTYGNS